MLQLRRNVLGHRCKKLFIIEVAGFTDDDEDGAVPAECAVLSGVLDAPAISLHAITGVRAQGYQTMKVYVSIGDAIAVALLDSGSSHNFIDIHMAHRAGLTLRGGAGLSVAVANGDRVLSPGKATAQTVYIGGEEFAIDLYTLPLGDYDMVLGIQWLGSLGPILWDFSKHTMRFSRQGRHVLWHGTDATTGVSTATLTGAGGDLMEVLLEEFASLFEEPRGLPPCRHLSHRIRLQSGAGPVAVRPYRYAHLQKDELERQCDEMLRQGVIRPSLSAFSSPALLIRKADGTWRFCVDHRALNDVTVKDKFPIPVVEELLDELRGARFFTKLDMRFGYWQVLMHPDDVEKTAFRTHQGLFEFLLMPFGLTNAPATFQALMNDILQPFLRRFVLVFFDDILIYSSSWSEHLRHIRTVFRTL